MSAVEVYTDRPAPLPAISHQDAAVQRLSEWAHSAQAAHSVAVELVRTSFVPESFRGKPHEATAAILAGLEIGLSPMAALRSFDVIQGQAAPRAITLRAVVQSFGHEIELLESTSTRCKMRGRRNGSNAWQEVTWTIDRAKSLKLTNKPNWQNQPQAMLIARATSELARIIAADAILGIGYSSEELADGAGAGVEVPVITTADPAAIDSPTAPSGSKRMSRKSKPQPEPDVPTDADADVIDGEVVETDPDAITPAQLKKLHASFNDQGITDRAERLEYVNATLGRHDNPVGSSKELTKDEASKVIDMLEAAPPIDGSSDTLFNEGSDDA